MIRTVFRKCLFSSILTTIFSILSVIVDSFFIGQYLDVDSLAAFGFAFPITYFIFAIAMMLSVGGQIVAGNYLGLKDQKSLNQCFSTSVVSAVVLSVICIIFFSFAIDPVIFLLSGESSGNVFDCTKAYLFPLIPAIFPMIMVFALTPFAQINNKQKYITASMLIMLAINVIVDALACLVFKNGITGIALATTSSFYVCLILLVIFGFSSNNNFKFRLNFYSFVKLKNMVLEGLIPFLNSATSVLFTLCFNLCLSAYGSVNAVAAFAIVNNIINVVVSPAVGVSSLTASLASMFYTDRDRHSLVSVLKVSFSWSLTLSAILIALVMVFSDFFVSIFLNSDPEVCAIASSGVFMCISYIIFTAIDEPLKKHYQVMGYKKYTIFLIVAGTFVFRIAFVFLIAVFFDPAYVYLAFVINEALLVAIIIIVSMIFNKSWRISIKNLALFPKDFGLDTSTFRAYAIKDLDKASLASKLFAEECLELGLDKDLANTVALCVEEFSIFLGDKLKTNKLYQLNVKLSVQPDKVLLSFMDNAKPTSKENFVQLYDDVSKNMNKLPALSAVKEKSDKFEITYALQLNNYRFTFLRKEASK